MTAVSAPKTTIATGSLFTRYRVEIAFRDKILGATPKRADLIEGWIRSKAKVTDEEEIRAMMYRTLLELGVEVPEEATYEEMVAASKSAGVERATQGFKRDGELGLYIETRIVKAALKESTNILYPYVTDKWGATKKTPRSYLAERIFIEGNVLPLGRQEPDGVDLIIGHPDGPQGKKSTLNYHEFCAQPTVSFVILSAEDSISMDQWHRILWHSSENGLGAKRSQGYGRYDVLDMVRLKQGAARPFTIREEE
jgi:hypothetical protein